MKETFTYYIDAIVYATIFSLTIMILKYFEADINYFYTIIFSLIIFVVGKMALKKLLYNRKKPINQDKN